MSYETNDTDDLHGIGKVIGYAFFIAMHVALVWAIIYTFA